MLVILINGFCCLFVFYFVSCFWQAPGEAGEKSSKEINKLPNAGAESECGMIGVITGITWLSQG